MRANIIWRMWTLIYRVDKWYYHRSFGIRKSSLAFDTIYAEASVATLSRSQAMLASFWVRWISPTLIPVTAFRRRFPSIRRPPQKSRSPLEPLRKSMITCVFMRIGIPHCPECGRVIERQTTIDADKILEAGRGRALVLAPCCFGSQG